MLLKIIIFIVLTSILTLSESYSVVLQIDIWSNLKQLNLEFSDDDKKLIHTIEQKKENAKELIIQAGESGNRADLENAFDELFSASRNLFGIYARYCKIIRDELPENLPPELDRPVNLERRAREKLSKSEILRNQADDTDEFTRAERIYMMTFDLEQLALLHMGRALRLYQDLPVIYAYQWYDDYTIMTGIPQKIITTVNEELKEIKEGPVKEDLAGEQIRHQQPGNGITYIVQIAAHSSEIPEKDIRNIYGGSRQIKVMIEENWYKYYFGPYNTFEEAAKVMKSLDMDNTFLAAYFNGKRIGIGEARKKQAEEK